MGLPRSTFYDAPAARLDDAEPEVSMDAYREFANCDYSDFKDIARTLPADKIVKWLKAADTQPFRVGLYASMLGHCGKAENAAVIKEILADPDRRVGSGVDGLLAKRIHAGGTDEDRQNQHGPAVAQRSRNRVGNHGRASTVATGWRA